MPPKANKSKNVVGDGRREWPDHEKKVTLQYLIDSIQSGLIIEKPTASIYYAKLQDKIGLKDVTPTQIKNVVKNLKKSYDSIIAWRNKTGEGIVDESYVREYILKKCPLFDLLDEIYGTRASVSPPFLHETNDEDNSERTVTEDDSVIITEEDLLDVNGGISSRSVIEESESPPPRDEVMTPTLPSTTKIAKREPVILKRKAPITTSMGLIAAASKQRSDLAVQRLEFEREAFDRKEKMDLQSLDLQKEEMQLKKEIELGKLDIEREKNKSQHEVNMKQLSIQEQKLKNEEMKLQLELLKYSNINK